MWNQHRKLNSNFTARTSRFSPVIESDLIAVLPELLRTHNFCFNSYNLQLSSLLLSLLHKDLQFEAYVESLFGIVMHKDGDKG